MHVFKFSGKTLALDPITGTLLEVDDLAGEVLKLWHHLIPEEITAVLSARYSVCDLAEALSEVEELVAAGLLDAIMPPEPVPTDASVGQVKALCLHVAHDCNLRCRYCFAGTGNFGCERTIMDTATGRAAIDFLLRSSGPRRHLEVDFFGGEPLLNFPVVRDIVAYGEEQAAKFGKVIRFTLTTNATLLDDAVIEFLNDKQMAVVLSLDGREAVNDRMRPLADGAGSYSAVSQAVREFVKRRNGENYYVRGTYTAHNLDFATDVMHLYNLGLRELSIEPVVGGAGESYTLTQDHLAALCREYERLADFYLAKQDEGDPFNFFHFNMATYGGPCFGKRVSGCGAGCDYLAVTPAGDLYPCHQFVGQQEFAMGSVYTGVTATSLVSEFGRANLYRKPECLRCFAKFFCSGGCHAHAYHSNGTILQPDALHCELQKKRIEIALGISAFRNVQ
ncbi:MAG: Anaerobic sulfatase-maturating enzyme [Firmicutes bacterium]|nr:Anaerobic sulfatase-maturating enzyme [Bacillota bacterium]